MKNYFGKKVLGLAGMGMAVMLGCTACADWQTGKTDGDVNQSVNMENVNQSVNVEKETGDTQENQEINQYVNSEDSDKSDSNFFREADLQGSVVEFSDSGFEMSIAVTTKEGDGEVMVEAAPGAEKEEDLVTITYASDVTFEILTMDMASLTEISREGTDKESIKKKTSVLIFGSSQDTYHWTADKVMIVRWK